MINLYAYRMIRASFLRNVKRMDRRIAIEHMVMARRKFAPELTVY